MTLMDQIDDDDQDEAGRWNCDPAINKMWLRDDTSSNQTSEWWRRINCVGRCQSLPTRTRRRQCPEPTRAVEIKSRKQTRRTDQESSDAISSVGISRCSQDSSRWMQYYWCNEFQPQFQDWIDWISISRWIRFPMTFKFEFPISKFQLQVDS